MSTSLEQPLDHDTTATAGPDGGPEAPCAGDTGDDSSSECEKVPANLPAVVAKSLFAAALQGDHLPRPVIQTDLILVEAPDQEWLPPIAEVAPAVLLGWHQPPGRRHVRDFQSEPLPFSVIQCTDTSSKAQKYLIGEVTELLRDGRAAIVVAIDIKSALPEQLQIAADQVFALSVPADGWLQDLAFAATGEMPEGELPVLAFGDVKPAMLGLALRQGQSPADYLRRLAALIVPPPCSSPRELLTLDQLHGMADVVAWGRDLARDLAAYRAGKLSWAEVDRGALLYGPPGTGKTTVARAIAAHCAVPFFPTSYADWQSAGTGHLGDVTRALKEVFAKARKAAPSIIFIDELDSLPRRDGDSKHAEWWQNLVNTLLQELDGAASRDGVVVIAASNYPEQIDPALRRAGRLDRAIAIPRPPVSSLEGIIAVHFGDSLAKDDRVRLAHLAYGHTGADIEQWARGAKRRARAEERAVAMADVLAEIVGDLSGYSPEYLRLVAVHEAGHAVVTTLLNPASPPSLILGRNGKPAGETTTSQAHDEAVTTGRIDNHLAAMLAGRAAELVIFGDVSAGSGGPADSDLGQATRLAAMAEASLGLGETGLVWCDVSNDAIFHHQMAARPALQSAVHRRLTQAFDQAVAQIRLSRHAVEALADALLEHQVLPPSEVGAIVAQALGAGVEAGVVQE